MRILLLISCYLLTLPTFAIYDLASINITPNSQGTKFCFLLDTNAAKELYLAIPIANNLSFLSTTDTGQLMLTTWQPPQQPPFFSTRTLEPSCLGPFSEEILKEIQVYAGVGNDFGDILRQQRYRKIFDHSLQETPPVEKRWTVMVYLVGSSLEQRQNSTTLGIASKDILEMLTGMQLSENREINVVITTGGSSREGWKTVKRSLIRDGQLQVLADVGEQMMNDSKTLSDFVLWAEDQFPAQHYALVLWNHGGGTQGFGQDTSTNAKAPLMSLPKLHQAYQTIRAKLGKPLELVVYDACLMATMEVAEITSTVANVMAGSVEIEPAHGMDYSFLLEQLITTLPTNGIALAEIAKTSYIQQSKEQKTFKTSQIAYSILDLTQLPSLQEPLNQFAEELEKQFRSLDNYEALSQGIIRVPGYPFKETGKLLVSLDEKPNIRIDFYNFIQTITDRFPSLKSQAEALQTSLQQLIVEYETNERIKAINPEAGRISLDIGSEKSYLSVLPQAYTRLNQAFDYYNKRRKDDLSKPNGLMTCATGKICADARWLKLRTNEVVAIDGYYGQQTELGMDVYLIKPLYRHRSLTEDLEIGVDGKEACQYQLCVNDTECSKLTVTENQGLRLADVKYNDKPAILTLCQEEGDHWKACGILPQQDDIWSREEPLTLAVGDNLTATLFNLQGDKLTSYPSQTLLIGETVPFLKQSCDSQTAMITANYFGNNQKPQWQPLCDQGDCVCEENDKNVDCIATSNQFKAGVYLDAF